MSACNWLIQHASPINNLEKGVQLHFPFPGPIIHCSGPGDKLHVATSALEQNDETWQPVSANGPSDHQPTTSTQSFKSVLFLHCSWLPLCVPSVFMLMFVLWFFNIMTVVFRGVANTTVNVLHFQVHNYLELPTSWIYISENSHHPCFFLYVFPL